MVGLTVTAIVFNVFAVHASYLDIGILEGRSASYSNPGEYADKADMAAAYLGLVSLAQLVVLISAVVASCMWIYRACSNAFALTQKGMETTPGWAVGWFFIPFANLWKPYQAMREIWVASENPGKWFVVDRPAILPVWWFLWIASSIFDNISLRYGMGAVNTRELLTSDYLFITSDLLDIPLNIAFIYVVRGLWKVQKKGSLKAASEVFA